MVGENRSVPRQRSRDNVGTCSIEMTPPRRSAGRTRLNRSVSNSTEDRPEDPLDESIKLKYTQPNRKLPHRCSVAKGTTIGLFVVLTASGVTLHHRLSSGRSDKSNGSSTETSSRRQRGAPVIRRSDVWSTFKQLVFHRAAGRDNFRNGLENLTPSTENSSTAVADYGGLQYSVATQRELQKHDDRLLDWYREDLMELFFAQDSEENTWLYGDAYVDPAKTCLWPKAVYTQKPNCLRFHEFSFDRLDGGADYQELRYLGSGYYRDTFLVVHEENDFVMKRQRIQRKMNRNRQQKVTSEALIMDQLTTSRRISNIYGHCGFSIAVEAAAYGMETSVLPLVENQQARGKMTQEMLKELSVDDAFPLNNYTAVEKLDLLLQLTESLAETHGLQTGPIVLGDMAVDQWLMARAGDGDETPRLILNDFDNAVFLAFNSSSNSYCPYESGYVGGFRAPEEHHSSFLTESVDMWKVGSVIFAYLTGLKPYHSAESSSDQWDRLDAKELPELDPRFETRSLIEERLVEIMRRCHQFNPNDRADIFEVVAFLRETKQLHEQKSGQRI